MERSDLKDSPPPPPILQSKGKSWTSRFRKKSDDHMHEKKKQLQAYTAWVNSYLKKRAGIPLVVDLRSTLQDGITFVNLIEIVACVQLEGIERNPNSSATRKFNMDKAINFLRNEGVLLQGDPTKDILDGNSKGIMRVILAIAERYQPHSIKPRSPSDASPRPYSNPYPSDRDPGGRDHLPWDQGGRDHMTYTLHTDSNDLKRSQSPEGNIHGGLNRSIASNSSSVPNMVSMNIHSGGGGGGGGASGGGGGGGRGGASVARSKSGYRYFSSTRGPTSPTLPSHQGSSYPAPSSSSQRIGKLAQPFRRFQYPDSVPDPLRPGGPTAGRTDSQDQDDTYATPADTLPSSFGTRVIPSMKKQGQGRHHPGHHPAHVTVRSVPEDRRLRAMSSPITGVPPGGLASGSSSQSEGSSSGTLNQEIGVVLTGLEEFKDELMQLHSLLRKNSDGSTTDLIAKNLNPEFSDPPELPDRDDMMTTPTPRGDTPPRISPPRVSPPRGAGGSGREMARDLPPQTQQVITLQEHLTQLQDEVTQKESECVTLRNLLEERNSFITTMKSEIYRKEYKNDTQRVDLQNQILQKDAAIKKLEADLASTRESMERRESEYEEVSSQLALKSETEERLQKELEGLKTDLTRLKEAEEMLQRSVTSKERKVGHLEERLAELQEARNKRSDSVSEDMDGIRKGLSQLRDSFSAQDSQQQVIDALEHNISEMMAQLMDRATSPSGKRNTRRHRDSEEHHREKDRERRKRHRDKHSSHTASGGGDSKVEPTAPTGVGGTSGDITKVFYYMLNDKTETPYVTLVPGKSSEITLKKFKSVFDRQGTFRFYFKTEDPDCGVVKEEITADDKVLPNWKGKILVWVSETK